MFDLERAKAIAASLSKPVEQLQPSDIASTVGELLGLDGKSDQISWAADTLFSYLNEFLDFETWFEDRFLNTPNDEWGPFPGMVGVWSQPIIPGTKGPPFGFDVKIATQYVVYLVDCSNAGQTDLDWRWLDEARFSNEKKSEIRNVVRDAKISRRNHNAMSDWIEALVTIVSQIVLWTKQHRPQLCHDFHIIDPTFGGPTRTKALRLKTLVPFVLRAGFFASELPGSTRSIGNPELRVDPELVEKLRELSEECDRAASRYATFSFRPYRHEEWSEIATREERMHSSKCYGDQVMFALNAPDGAEQHLAHLWSLIAPLISDAYVDDRERGAGAYSWLMTRYRWRESETINGGAVQIACNPLIALGIELRRIATHTSKHNRKASSPNNVNEHRSNSPGQGCGLFPVDLTKIAYELFGLDHSLNHFFPDGYFDNDDNSAALVHWRAISESVDRIRALLPPNIALADCDESVRGKLRQLIRFLPEIEQYPTPGSNFDELLGDVATVLPIYPDQRLKDWSKRIWGEFLEYRPEPSFDRCDEDSVDSKTDSDATNTAPTEPIERPPVFEEMPTEACDALLGFQSVHSVVFAFTQLMAWEKRAIDSALRHDRQDENLRRRWRDYRVGQIKSPPVEGQTTRQYAALRPKNEKPVVVALYEKTRATMQDASTSSLLDQAGQGLDRLYRAHLACVDASHELSFTWSTNERDEPNYEIPDDVLAERDDAWKACKSLIDAIFRSDSLAKVAYPDNWDSELPQHLEGMPVVDLELVPKSSVIEYVVRSDGGVFVHLRLDSANKRLQWFPIGDEVAAKLLRQISQRAGVEWWTLFGLASKTTTDLATKEQPAALPDVQPIVRHDSAAMEKSELISAVEKLLQPVLEKLVSPIASPQGKKKRGGQRVYDPKVDRRIREMWNTRCYTSRQALADELKMELPDVARSLDRSRKSASE